MPVPGAAIRLGPCGTGLAATFQATTCRRSRRGVSRYAAGTLPCGSNHVRYTRDTPSPLGLSPHTGPASPGHHSRRGSLRHPLRRLAYPQRLARLAPGQRPEQPPLPTVPPCACRARRPWKTCLSQCAGLRAGFPQVRPVDKSGWHVKGARAAPTGWRGPQPEGRGLGPGGANP